MVKYILCFCKFVSERKQTEHYCKPLPTQYTTGNVWACWSLSTEIMLHPFTTLVVSFAWNMLDCFCMLPTWHWIHNSVPASHPELLFCEKKPCLLHNKEKLESVTRCCYSNLLLVRRLSPCRTKVTSCIFFNLSCLVEFLTTRDFTSGEELHIWRD